MGSSGSRLSGSAVDAAQGSRPLRRNPQNFLAPLLSSLRCGTSSSWRMDSFTQERMNTSGDHLARQISLEKPAAHEGQPSILRLQSRRDTDNSDISDEQSIIDISEVSLQSLCGSVESVDPSLFNGCNSSVVDDANTSLSGQRHISLVRTDMQAANLSSSHSVFGTQSSNDDCFSISNDSYHEHSSNHSTPVGQNNTDCSVGDVSRIEVMPDCIFKQESSANCSDLERMPSFIHDSSNMAMNTSLLQDTLSSELSTNLGVLRYDASSPAEAVDSSSISRPESSGREARRNNRRRLWDALTRVSSRRRSFSPFYMQPDEDGDSSRTLNDDWGLFDWNSHELSNQITHESGAVSRRSSTMEDRRWRARPQAQHYSDSMGRRFGHSRHCAFGRHPNGNCTCEAFVLTEESSTGASISRIVMLAEALFEVLDEIHRQSVTLSRSTSYSLVSFPAPEEVVNSFASRIHNKSDPSMSLLGQCAECYICLVEYEDGDRIRVLPCCHEFHMLCVDRWLKEAHRVCPLCRCNVCEESIKT